MKRLFLALSLVIVSFLILALVSGSTTAETALKEPTPATLLTLVNKERERYGAEPLILDERLNRSAQLKAADMDANHYFNHVDSTGKHGYTYVTDVAPDLCQEEGENITDNIIVNDAAHAVEAWINSPPHHKAMIDKASVLTGFGIAGTKIVEHFCQPV